MATAAVLAGRLEIEVFVDEIARDDFGVEAGGDFGDAHIEGAGNERDDEADDGGGAFDESGFWRGVFELEEVHAEIEVGRDEEAKDLKTEIDEGEREVEVVEVVEG